MTKGHLGETQAAKRRGIGGDDGSACQRIDARQDAVGKAHRLNLREAGNCEYLGAVRMIPAGLGRAHGEGRATRAGGNSGRSTRTTRRRAPEMRSARSRYGNARHSPLTDTASGVSLSTPTARAACPHTHASSSQLRRSISSATSRPVPTMPRSTPAQGTGWLRTLRRKSCCASASEWRISSTASRVSSTRS